MKYTEVLSIFHKDPGSKINIYDIALLSLQEVNSCKNMNMLSTEHDYNHQDKIRKLLWLMTDNRLKLFQLAANSPQVIFI